MSIKDIVFGWQVGSQIMNLQMAKKHVDMPVEPIVSMYFYGTPAQTTVTYNGVELPDIETVWDKSKYPYAYMFYVDMLDGMYLVVFCSCEAYQDGDVTKTKTAGTGVGVSYIPDFDEDWQFVEELTFEANEVLGGNDTIATPYVWCSHDILNADGSVCLAATEPVHSGNIGLQNGETVTYYDGIVCSEIPSTPEGHTYAYIFRKLSNGRISARYFSHPLYQKENYIYCERDVGSTLRGSNYDPNTNSWSEPVWWSHSSSSNQEFPDDYRFDFYACLWANTDIVSDDGSVYLAATDPIQVGEIVDTINGIPIYEIKEAI